jgi:uncharacterized membrane protein (UPF0127 family)
MSKQRPYTKGIIIIITSLVLIIAVILTVYSLTNVRPTTTVRLGSAVFSMRLAATNETRQQGLSGIAHLGAMDGLLMVFQGDDYWGIWMKDMKIPLDIIWLNNEKKVIYIVSDASPSLGTSKTFTPTDTARYVLEVLAGTTKRVPIQVGDNATFSVAEARS